MRIKVHLERLVNATPESFEELIDCLDDVIDILVEMNGYKKSFYVGSSYCYLEDIENEQGKR